MEIGILNYIPHNKYADSKHLGLQAAQLSNTTSIFLLSDIYFIVIFSLRVQYQMKFSIPKRRRIIEVGAARQLPSSYFTHPLLGPNWIQQLNVSDNHLTHLTT